MCALVASGPVCQSTLSRVFVGQGNCSENRDLQQPQITLLNLYNIQLICNRGRGRIGSFLKQTTQVQQHYALVVDSTTHDSFLLIT